MASVGLKELLEAGVHFGHQTRRWNPRMRRFIFGERDGIYFIDLLKTERLLEEAREFSANIARRGGTVLFVGTKKQARDAVKEIAEQAGMPYVNHRWLGGLLTNFQTISLRTKRLHELERYEAEGQLELLPTRERLAAQADLAKLRANLGGVKDMQRVPDAMFVIDLKVEEIAVREARRLRIPIIGLVDTNCDPDGIDYVVPGNDDAMRACRVITAAIGDVVGEGRSTFRAEEERARQEAEEKARREAEEKARREAEAEEKARAEAEEQARRDTEAQLTHGGEGQPRQQAEETVAAAVQSQTRNERMAEGQSPAVEAEQDAARADAHSARRDAQRNAEDSPVAAPPAGPVGDLTPADEAASVPQVETPAPAGAPQPEPAALAEPDEVVASSGELEGEPGSPASEEPQREGEAPATESPEATAVVAPPERDTPPEETP